jgi:ubiquinone/menaquinone biosynthesis C-methylase UbiE
MSGRDVLRDWWERNPMTYGVAHGTAAFAEGEMARGTRAFFERLDREFYRWNAPLHERRPFDRLFPYARYGNGAEVLEIGCGFGTMAMNWAQAGARITAIDLNATAVAETRARFALFGLQGDIREADARDLPFASGRFDYAYSWGVLHHAPDLERSVAEMMRVLKKGGGFGLMLYHRRSFMHLYMTRYVEGFLHYESRFLDALALASRYGDARREEGNPYTWPVTKRELGRLLGPFAREVEFRVLGTDLDMIFKFLLPGLGSRLPVFAKKPWARRFGWSLWASGRTH